MHDDGSAIISPLPSVMARKSRDAMSLASQGELLNRRQRRVIASGEDVLRQPFGLMSTTED